MNRQKYSETFKKSNFRSGWMGKNGRRPIALFLNALSGAPGRSTTAFFVRLCSRSGWGR